MKLKIKWYKRPGLLMETIKSKIDYFKETGKFPVKGTGYSKNK